MKNSKTSYIKNPLLPSLVYSVITGIFTGILIFLFKVSSGYIMELSASIYSFVRQNPHTLPFLLAGALVLGLTSSFILKHAKNCRGGGIPTSIAILKELIEFKWLSSIICLFSSACITFFGGIPLGNEGPSVQMGTAVGKGTVCLLAKNHKDLSGHIMAGGACAGFAAATGAPLSGILFAFEEARLKFSPLLFITASITVVCSTATMRLLCGLLGISPFLFDFLSVTELPAKYILIAAITGIVCAIASALFTKLYSAVGKLSLKLQNLPFTLKVLITFIVVALCGFACSGFIGSGHSLIHELTEGKVVWYLILLYFCVRALLLMFANHFGITGGIFVPTLTFGALTGALISQIAIQLGALQGEYFIIPIILGMACFLASSAKTPIMAAVFFLEALSGFTNILCVFVGVALSYLTAKLLAVPAMHEVVIQKKAEKSKNK